MKKILYIGNRLASSGGNVTTIETLSEWLKLEGFDVFSYSDKKNKWLRLIDMLFHTFKLRAKTDVVLIDTYSTQNFYYSVCIAGLCRALNLPYIPILHGGNLPERLKRNPKISNRLFGGAKVNVSPSRYLVDQFKTHGINNVIYIPNSIEIRNYPYHERHDIRPKILWVRSFADIYNPILALNVLELLIENGIPAELCMVGPDKDGSLEKCKAIAIEKNLPVTFTGKLQKKEWIALSKDYDIFINTTNFDNMPVSVIEAMALGLPVISTDVGGMTYMIENGRTGLLVPPNNEKSFVDCISDLIDDQKKASYLSLNARKMVEQFDWEVVKQHWFSVLGE